MSRIIHSFAALAAVIALAMALGCASTVEEADQMDICVERAEQLCPPNDNACYESEYADCMEEAGYFVR